MNPNAAAFRESLKEAGSNTIKFAKTLFRIDQTLDETQPFAVKLRDTIEGASVTVVSMIKTFFGIDKDTDWENPNTAATRDTIVHFGGVLFDSTSVLLGMNSKIECLYPNIAAFRDSLKDAASFMASIPTTISKINSYLKELDNDIKSSPIVKKLEALNPNFRKTYDDVDSPLANQFHERYLRKENEIKSPFLKSLMGDDKDNSEFNRVKNLNQNILDVTKGKVDNDVERENLSRFTPKVFVAPTDSDLKKETINIGGYTIRSDVYQAIQQASNKYGVPLDYMLAMAHKESGFNPNIKAPTSSATGLFQFISKTWKGLWGTPTPDPKDPYANADAAARYTKQIQEQLSTNDPASLYLGHFLGASGASKLLRAMEKNAETPVTEVVSPDQIQANKSVFTSRATVADIYEWANRNIGKTMAKIGKIDKSINSLASLQQKQLEPQYQRQEPRNQLNIQPVGQIEDFSDKIQEASMKPQPAENEPPVIPVQEAQREIQPVVLNVSQPTQTQVSTPINREQPLPKQLTDILNSIFDSTVAVFTQTNKAFVFGESLNANPLMI
jgi:hypothetical protein